MDWTRFIAVTPGVRGGKPCLIGTRITPTDVLVRAVLAYAAERERRYATHSELTPRAVDRGDESGGGRAR